MRCPNVVPQGIDMNLRTWLQFLRDDVGQMEKASPFETRVVDTVSGKTSQVRSPQGNGYVGAIPVAYSSPLDILTIDQRADGGLDIYAEFVGARQQITFILVKR